MTEESRPAHGEEPGTSECGAKVRLLLLDDHGLFRDGLSRLLGDEPDLEVVAQCSSVSEMHRVLGQGRIQRVDLMLLDYDLGEDLGEDRGEAGDLSVGEAGNLGYAGNPGQAADRVSSNGFHALEAARSLGFTGRVLLVTAGMAPAEMVRAFHGGVSGLFLKHSPPQELVRAIHQVMRGEPWPDRASFEKLLASAERDARDRDFVQNRGFQGNGSPRPPSLTPRERAVLRGVFEGRLNKEIAADLGVSEGSVKAVLQQLFSKTGVRSRAQLVRIALENRYEYELYRG